MRFEFKADPPPVRLKPTGDKVEVELVRQPDRTEGGIMVPSSTGWVTAVVRVISTGPDCKQAKRGDLALVPTTVESKTLRFGGYETFLCEEGYLLAVLTPEEGARVLAETLATVNAVE